MTQRQVYVLLGILVFLLLTYFGLRFLRGGAPLEAAALGLDAVTPEGVDSVVFAKPDDTLRLRRADSGWQVGRWPADSARIEGLWRAAGEAAASNLVARSPANHARLGVADSAAVRVTFYSGGEPGAELLVGASGPSWPSAYVRRPGEDEVYLMRGELATLVRRGATDWRVRRIAQFDPVRADRVILRTAEDSVTLERRDTTWTVATDAGAPAPADSVAVRRAVESLSRLQSAGYAPDSIADALSFEPPTARVRVLDADGAVLADLLVLEREEGSYWVKRAAGPDVWDVSRFSVEDFLKPADDFRAAPGP